MAYVYKYTEHGFSTMSCATCGGDDHRRSSSSRCPLRKKRARESTDDDGPFDTYTVKRGLAGFICPLLSPEKREKLLCEIRHDVKDLSSLSINFSILVHYFYTSYLVRFDDEEEFLRLYPKFNGIVLAASLITSTLKRKKLEAGLPDSNGVLEKWSGLCKREYDGKHRSFLKNHIIKRYATELETNVCTHAFSRIKRAINAKTDLDKKVIHDACYARYYSGQLVSGCFVVDNWFDSQKPEPPTASALQRDFWRFIPMFHRLQREAWVSAVKSSKTGRRFRGFKLFPQYRHGLKHLLYDSAAFFELLRRIDKESTPSTWKEFNKCEAGTEAGSRLFWRRYFTCPKNFGYSITTDGVSVSLTMCRKSTVMNIEPKKKKRKNAESPVQQAPVSQVSCLQDYVAVDPGAREPIVTCTENSEGNLVFRKLTAGRVYFDTGELWREKKRKRITALADERVREAEKMSDTMEAYSSKHGGDPQTYVEFRLKHFEDLQRVYEKRKLARLRFDKYSRRQKFMSKVVNEFFPNREQIILYGVGCKFMNRATFRGHRKFSHDSLLREIKRSGRTVLLVDEAYTTKKCYRCYGSSDVKVSPSPHRYVHCPVCRRGVNRDRNGAANILLKSTGRWKQHNCQLLPPTDPKLSCRSNTDSPLP